MDRHRRGGGHNDSSTVGVGVVTSRATLDVGQGRSSSDPPPSSSSRRRFVVRDDHPYPWWFVTLLRDLPSSGVYGPWHELDTSSTIPRPLKFCAIGKNGCTEWRKVFKSLNAHEYCDDDDEEEHVVEGRKRAVACGASKFNTRAVLDENDVPRSVFLRDPLERLLSGYLDKCVKPNVRVFQGHCEPNVVFGVDHLRRKEGQGNGKKVGGSPPPDMTVVLKDFEREMFASYVDLLPLKWNVHFVPQSFVCDLYRKIDDYDFVGIMGRDFARELDRMANRYGGSLPDALDVAFDYRSKIINDTLVVDNVGSDKAHGTKAPAKVHRYYSPGTVRRALEYLSIDYVALGLEVPLWAREMLRDDAGNRT
ncbi:hypothetical protein ACHAXA_004274 [Cyclostephanos tholiformis]|uniref:Sulfotransferase n=1 Tax=Cyclostephanos tholiformis TaxID=382380 RepID=A0ABD3RBC3_9STRA